MARLSINELTTLRWHFEDDVARYAAAGIRALGVWRTKLSDYGEDEGIELLAEHDLGVSNLMWAGGFTGSEVHRYGDAVKDAIEGIRLAAALRAGCLVLYSGGRAGHTRNHARDILIDALHDLEPFAAEHGVTVALEPMHVNCAEPCTFLCSLDETLSVLDDLASPYLKLVFDTYHLGHDGAVIERIPQFVDRIAVVHLGDGRHPPRGEQNRCRLGEGTVPLREIVSSLAAAGYDGYYDVELMGEDVEPYEYSDLLTHSKHAFDRLAASVAMPARRLC